MRHVTEVYAQPLVERERDIIGSGFVPAISDQRCCGCCWREHARLGPKEAWLTSAYWRHHGNGLF